ncbi:hypothetical protein B0H10DRAFT_2218419 [Mycena sp. CBHHK59/15]|nr:hypothetical protein B0H10DRAFT_2218419 [Mycena sp. CBHHK59/15]
MRILTCCHRSSSSGSVNELQAAAARSKPTRGSPLRDGVAFDVGEVAEDDANASAGGKAHKVQLPGRTASDSSGTSTSASSSGSSTRKHRREKSSSSAAEEGEKEKILIVLLDEKDKTGTTRGVGRVMTTRHGTGTLERRLSTRSTPRKPSSTSSAHHSPWMGPLVHLDEDVKYIHVPEHSDSSDSEDDDDDDGSDWDGQRGGGAVVPIKSMLTAMGYLTPEAAVMGGSGGASPYSPYAGTLPMQTPYNSPYAAAAAQLAAYSSPYVAPLSLPYPSQQGSPYAQPLPPSRPQTPMSYFAGGTPQQQWGSPAPAGYTSPSASYANLAAAYANSAVGYVSPNAGYASPAAYASPGAGYANLAAGYSSPYVPLQQGTGTGGSHYYG